MCKNFLEGTCKSSQCTFAHHGDGYEHLTAHVEVRRTVFDRAEPAKKPDDMGTTDEEG